MNLRVNLQYGYIPENRGNLLMIMLHIRSSDYNFLKRFQLDKIV